MIPDPYNLVGNRESCITLMTIDDLHIKGDRALLAYIVDGIVVR